MAHLAWHSAAAAAVTLFSPISASVSKRLRQMVANACGTAVGVLKKDGQKALPRKSMTRLALPVERSIVLGLSSVTFTSI